MRFELTLAIVDAFDQKFRLQTLTSFGKMAYVGLPFRCRLLRICALIMTELDHSIGGLGDLVEWTNHDIFQGSLYPLKSLLTEGSLAAEVQPGTESGRPTSF